MKKFEKRVISVALIIALIATMINLAPAAKDASVSHAAPLSEGEVVRGVVENISDLPQSKVDDWQNLDRGTPQRPFVVLEVVPYEEYAAVGYMIGGCEPINIERSMPNRSIMQLMYELVALGFADITLGEKYMFLDELSYYYRNDEKAQELLGSPDRMEKLIGNEGEYTTLTDGYIYGYYEKVAPGTGTFKMELSEYVDPDAEEDGGDVSPGDVSPGDPTPVPTPGPLLVNFVRASGEGADWIWVSEGPTSMNEHEGYYPAGEILFASGLVDEDQDKFYTLRQASLDDAVYSGYNYGTYYKNKEFFLKQCIGLEDDATVDNYSVVVKTITIGDLNNNPEWIDYSDLIYMSVDSYYGNGVKMWQLYNSVWETGKKITPDDERKANVLPDDLTWETALRMYNKITADKNYAGIMMDERLTKGNDTGNQFVHKKEIELKMFDWNFDVYKDPYGKEVTFRRPCSNQNIYKLAVMLMAMDSNLFKQLYLSGDDPIVKDGKHTLQEGDAQDYWDIASFLLMRPGVFTYDLWNYFTSPDMWDNYHTYLEVAGLEHYTQDHLFVFKSSELSMAGAFNADFGAAERFKDFREFCEKDGQPTSPAEAVKYILNAGDNGHYGDGMTINILDIEPSVGLDSNTNLPKWNLKETYLRMLIPSFTGKINIEHQTTAQFISMAEDLNAKYQMIFMGLDTGAYATRVKNVTLRNGTSANIQVPAWNDLAMYNAGQIYVHLGDMMFSAEYAQARGSAAKGNYELRSRSVNWIANQIGTVDSWNSALIRFPGNDISKIKRNELDSFLLSGRPIVAEEYLYNLESVIDSQSVVYKFVDDAKKDGTKPLFSVTSAAGIDDALRASSADAVTFIQLPSEYNGRTADGSNVISSPNYLPTDSGRAYLLFSFNVAEEGYSYRVYVDQDKDSKFDSNEIIFTQAASSDPDKTPNNTYKYLIGPSTVGLVQWKIEVYKTDNPYVRFVKTGCSAVRNNATSAGGSVSKKKVNVLQIMPFDWQWDSADTPYTEAEYNAGRHSEGCSHINWSKDSPVINNDGRLDLETNELFQYYSENLADYDLTIKSISWATFSKCFEDAQAAGRGFSYNYVLGIDEAQNNPQNADGLMVNVANIGEPEYLVPLDSFNMFVIGFGDTYGGTNLSNTAGQVDYLRYWLDMDKSILFTHDLTSLYNVTEDADGNMQHFGFTVNALMRDLMGMNRYGVVSKMANQTGNTSEANRLAEYQAQHADRYDTLEWYDGNRSVASHGYTYYSMKRLGWNNTTNKADNYNANYSDDRGSWPIKMPYKYMVTNPQGSTPPEMTGMNNDNDITTVVSKVNEGQVTTYPYYISDDLPVARTHGQWYALSPEDPDVTVWYTLSYDGDDSSKKNPNGTGGDGTSLTYGVSPKDGMNNYYIYSKGNIFYSGVGHSTIGTVIDDPQDMEVKLFINTMIAAFNASYDPPIVEVNNSESSLTKANGTYLEYRIELLQDFDELNPTNGGAYSSNVVYGAGDTYRVDFTPVDYNVVTTELKCTIEIGTSGRYIDTVRTATGQVLHANEQHEFILNNRQNYSLDYSKQDLNDVDTRTITFKIKNNRVAGYGTTDLKMSIQPLFPLD